MEKEQEDGEEEEEDQKPVYPHPLWGVSLVSLTSTGSALCHTAGGGGGVKYYSIVCLQ